MKFGSQASRALGVVGALSVVVSIAGLGSTAQAVTPVATTASESSASNFIFDPSADPIASRKLTVQSAVDLVLSQHASEWGIVPTEWKISRVGQATTGRQVVTLGQVFDGIDVLGSSIVLTLSADQALTSVQYQTSKKPAVMTAGLTAAQATAAIESAANNYWGNVAGTISVAAPKLIVIRDGLFIKTAPATLAYEASVSQSASIKRLTVRIDAVTGDVLSTTPKEKAVVQNPAICDAQLQTWTVMAQRTNGVLTTPAQICIPGHAKEMSPTSTIAIRDKAIVQNISNLFDPLMVNYPLDLDGNPATAKQPLSFNEMVGNSLSTGGARPVSIVTNFCFTSCPNTYVNAFWYSFPSEDTNQAGVGADQWFGGMFVGTGFESSDDVIAHEMTHGISSGYVSFDYELESGAIDESMSDIFGESVDQLEHRDGEVLADEAKWYIAEDAVLPQTAYNGPYRSMANPAEFGDPDRVGASTFQICSNPTQQNDSCYVHTNSGVPNKLAYLIARGGTFNGYTIAPLSTTPDTSVQLMNKLFFDVLAYKSTQTMTFKDLGNALIASCSELRISEPAFSVAACANVTKAVFATQVTAVSSAAPVMSKSTVKKGTTFTASSKIRLLNNNYPGALSVQYQFRRTGTTTWKTIATKTTTTTGTYKLTIKPTYSGSYRVFVPATATMPAAASSAVTVKVK